MAKKEHHKEEKMKGEKHKKDHKMAHKAKVAKHSPRGK